MKLKIGRKIFEITEKDVVLFNGACWQLISQEVFSGWNSYPPTISKTLCEKFVKKGILIESKKQGCLHYYKFNLNELNNYLTEQKGL